MTHRRIAVFLTAMMVVGTIAGTAGVAWAQTDSTAGDLTATDQSAGAAQTTVVGECTTIDESGRYVLVGDIEDSSADTCIRIRASDVVLEGNGNTIDGRIRPTPDEAANRFFRPGGLQPRSGIGIAVGGDRPVSNVTVRDVTLTDWRWAAVAESVRRGGFAGVRTADSAFGITVLRSPGFEVTDSEAVRNAAFGVGLFGSGESRVADTNASENGVVGVYLGRGRNAVVSNVVARDNDVAGVLLDRTQGAAVRGGTTSGNRFGVYLFETSDSEVTGATAVGNGLAGIYALNGSGASVADSVATNNRLSGVLIQGTRNAEITTTNASRNRYGIYLFFAEESTVADSTSNDGVMGVFVRNSTDSAVVNNTVLDNSFDGVYLENSSDVRVEENRDGALTIESTGDDTIGREGGYWYNDTIDVNQSDGLTEAELRAYVYRSIARAEYLRQLEYEESLSLELVSQAELTRRNQAEPASSATAAEWQNQLWEATFVVGEDRNATQVMENESSRVAGFYNSFADKMVIVSDDDPLTASSTTLVHEFVHALQDQHFDLTEGIDSARTEDGSRARSGLVEGDARYVEERFEQLCGVVWDCVQVDSKEPPGGEVSDSRNFALRQMILAPYSDGPGYVAQLRQQGGWEAVNDQYDEIPNTTEQIIHPDRRNESPVALSFEDTARADWNQFDQSNLSFGGVNGTTRMGEVGIFTMFWYQGYEYGNEIIDVNEHLYPNGGSFDWFNYTSKPSEGWGNDVLVPYRKQVGNDTEYGYVWRTAWDTQTDARQFHRAYLDLLRGQGAEKVGPNTWVVESGPFADAFRVVRQGSNVTIVNAPTTADLADLRPGLPAPESTTDDGNETTAEAA
ncbi:Hvo_1808 family surface protein [Halorussus lipolyticus]|uniref:Hvo_1808 family surface protein n=1 Tax=Halorussus lipolyticus TaxID=3034024 RepID=UPI0023E8CE48|nr:Hvo_1808 family surface protein [Halorussus sp. DT80]